MVGSKFGWPGAAQVIRRWPPGIGRHRQCGEQAVERAGDLFGLGFGPDAAERVAPVAVLIAEHGAAFAGPHEAVVNEKTAEFVPAHPMVTDPDPHGTDDDQGAEHPVADPPDARYNAQRDHDDEQDEQNGQMA